MSADAGSFRLPAQVKLVDLKIHHHVALADFDAVVATFVRVGGQPATRVDAEARYGVRIADFGSFDVIGLSGWPADDPRPSITAIIEGLQRVAPTLHRYGQQVVRPLQRDESGWSLVVEDLNGRRIEYRELA